MFCAKHGRSSQLGSWPVSRRSLAGPSFKKRLVQVASAITANPQHSLPKACNDWADLKGAYRFLSNPRVKPDAIQEPHRRQTRARCVEHPVVLCLQDTSELDFTRRKKVRDLGSIGDGRGRGLLQHTVLGVTPDRQVLGVLHQQWTKRIEVPEGETRAERLARPKKSDVWPNAVIAVGTPPTGTRMIHVCDREADSFELMRACADHDVGFLVRAQHNRHVNASTDKLWPFLANQPVTARRKIKLPAQHKRRARTAKLAVRCTKVTLEAPKGDPRFTEPHEVWAVYVTEERPPQDVEPLEWMLLTSEPTETAEEAWLRVDWYTVRWLIEEFHKVEKSGCRLEAAQLDDAADIKRLAAVIAVTAVRLLMLRSLAHRAISRDSTEEDAASLQRAVPWLWIFVVARANKKNPVDPSQLTAREFWLRIARQGGYIGRKHDGRPGWSTIWKGWYDFMFMFQGAELMAAEQKPKSCG